MIFEQAHYISQIIPTSYKILKQKTEKALTFSVSVARPGIEPGTSWLWIMRSNQLSYLAITFLRCKDMVINWESQIFSLFSSKKYKKSVNNVPRFAVIHMCRLFTQIARSCYLTKYNLAFYCFLRYNYLSCERYKKHIVYSLKDDKRWTKRNSVSSTLWKAAQLCCGATLALRRDYLLGLPTE